MPLAFYSFSLNGTEFFKVKTLPAFSNNKERVNFTIKYQPSNISNSKFLKPAHHEIRNLPEDTGVKFLPLRY